MVAHTDWLSGRRREKRYTPLLQLQRCDTTTTTTINITKTTTTTTMITIIITIIITTRCPSLIEKVRTVAKRRKIDMEAKGEEEEEEGMEGEEGKS